MLRTMVATCDCSAAEERRTKKKKTKLTFEATIFVELLECHALFGGSKLLRQAISNRSERNSKCRRWK